MDFSNAKLTSLNEHTFNFLLESGHKGWERRDFFITKALNEAIHDNDNTKLLFVIEAGFTEIITNAKFNDSFRHYLSGDFYRIKGKRFNYTEKNELRNKVWGRTHYWIGYGLPIGTKRSHEEEHAICKVAQEVSLSVQTVYPIFNELNKYYEEEKLVKDNPSTISEHLFSLNLSKNYYQQKGFGIRVCEFVYNENNSFDEGIKLAVEYFNKIHSDKKRKYIFYKDRKEINEEYIKRFIKSTA